MLPQTLKNSPLMTLWIILILIVPFRVSLQLLLKSEQGISSEHSVEEDEHN